MKAVELISYAATFHA